jgi:hypothetical protein
MEFFFVILDKINFNFVYCLFASPISAYAVPNYIRNFWAICELTVQKRQLKNVKIFYGTKLKYLN